MADNVQAGAAVGSGPVFPTADLTFSGDSVQVPGGFSGILAGSEGSWTYTMIVGGSGAVSAGVQRVCLATDVALPAGTNAIGKLAANSGVDIGDVDVLSIAAGDNNIGNVDIVTVPADPFGVNADAASATGSISAKLRFIAGTGIPITGTVTVGSHAVTNAGTFAVQAACTNAGTFLVQENGDALTALQLIDDVVYVDDADWTDSTSKHMLVGGLYQSTPQAITDGDVGPFQVDANGCMKVAIVSGAGSGGTAAADDADFTAGTTNGTPAMGVYESSPTSVTDGDLGTVGITQTRAMRCAIEGTVTVGSHEVTNAGTFAVQAAQSGTWDIGTVTAVTAITNALPAGTNNIGDVDVLTIAAGDNNIGNVDIVTVPADPFGANADAASATGSISAKLRFIAATGIPVTGTVTVGSHAVTNAGTFVVQIDGNALTSLQLIDDVIFADDAAFTPGTSKVAAIGMQADETATDSVDEGDIGCPRITLDRKQIATVQPHTSGGLLIHKRISAGSGDAANVKASAGQLYGWVFSNINAAPAYLKIYNSAGTPTAGAGTIVMTICIPGNTAGVAGHNEFTNGIEFTTGIAFTIVTGVADNNSTGVSANEVVVNLLYK